MNCEVEVLMEEVKECKKSVRAHPSSAVEGVAQCVAVINNAGNDTTT